MHRRQVKTQIGDLIVTVDVEAVIKLTEKHTDIYNDRRRRVSVE